MPAHEANEAGSRPITLWKKIPGGLYVSSRFRYQTIQPRPPRSAVAIIIQTIPSGHLSPYCL